MQLAKVIGSMVSTRKSDRLHGLKLLVAVPIDMDTFEEKGAPFITNVSSSTGCTISSLAPRSASTLLVLTTLPVTRPTSIGASFSRFWAGCCCARSACRR